MRPAAKVTGRPSCAVPRNGVHRVRPTQCQTRHATSSSPASQSLPSASAHDPAPNGETGGTIEPRTGEEGAAHDDYDIRPGRRRGGPSLQPVLLAQQDGARAYFVSTSQAPAACTDYRLD